MDIAKVSCAILGGEEFCSDDTPTFIHVHGLQCPLWIQSNLVATLQSRLMGCPLAWSCTI